MTRELTPDEEILIKTIRLIFAQRHGKLLAEVRDGKIQMIETVYRQQVA